MEGRRNSSDFCVYEGRSFSTSIARCPQETLNVAGRTWSSYRTRYCEWFHNSFIISLSIGFSPLSCHHHGFKYELMLMVMEHHHLTFSYLYRWALFLWAKKAFWINKFNGLSFAVTFWFGTSVTQKEKALFNLSVATKRRAYLLSGR